MNKIIWIGGGVIGLLLVVAAVYYFFFTGSDYGDPRPPKDLTGIIVPPVSVPLNGKTFSVPDATSTSVTLNLVSPTAKRDYPMGRFALATGTSEGSLVALDDFLTDYENNLRAVPISVNTGGSGDFFYLAILEGEEMKHVSSLPLGDRVKIQSVTREGNTVTVNYLVHDRLQAMVETPSVSTSAIFDIAAKTVVQAGRSPATEEYKEAKSFVGEYLWRDTVLADETKVTPNKPEAFTLLFDANQVVLGTDCNTGRASYAAEAGSSTVFTVEEIAATKKFCEAGQETEYFAMFKKITDYKETENGSIVFTLSDGATMTFVSKKQELEFEKKEEAEVTE